MPWGSHTMSGPALHEFIAQNREELLAMIVARMKKQSPERTDEELADGFRVIIDEIVRALQEHAGLPTTSPLPGKSQAAAQHGSQRQHRGYEIQKIPLDFGSISDSVGELGARQGLSFAADEYQVFNTCIDTAISSAIEQFSTQERQQQADDHQQRADDTTRRVGFLAHELRNALSTARMAFTLLRTTPVSIHEKTGNVLDRGLRRLESLVGNTLLAVQLDAGLKLEPTPMRVTELLRHVAETAVPERGIRVVIDADESLEIAADEQLVVSALSNLLQNAIKFTRADGGVILRARSEPGEAGVVILEVEDECGGLAPGKQDELFQPYVQRGSDRRGIGLGLAITREVVEAHGGEISVRNLPGKGCVFCIKLHRR